MILNSKTSHRPRWAALLGRMTGLMPLYIAAILSAADSDTSTNETARVAAPTNAVPSTVTADDKTTDLTKTNAPSSSTLTNAAGTNVTTPLNTNASTSTATNSGPTFATALDFPSFKIIADRNIFNPNRTSRSTRGGGGRGGGGPDPKPVRTESFSLVGTMSYGSNQMAFFDSSTARYRKAIKNGDSIADHKILSITVQGIRLEKEGKQFDMPMGSQMKRDDDAPWELKVAATVVPRSPTSASSGDSSSSSSSTGADNDVLKRLLQKREQELNK